MLIATEDAGGTRRKLFLRARKSEGPAEEMGVLKAVLRGYVREV